MGKAQNAETLSVHVSKTAIATIQKRADGNGISKSRFAALVLEKWVAEGCPPVSETDRAVMALSAIEKSLPAKATGKGAAEARKAS
jgi:hypothetical protein